MLSHVVGSNTVCTKLFSDWGFAPYPTEELTALPKPLAGKGMGKEGKGKGGKGMEQELGGK